MNKTTSSLLFRFHREFTLREIKKKDIEKLGNKNCSISPKVFYLYWNETGFIECEILLPHSTPTLRYLSSFAGREIKYFPLREELILT